MMDIWLLFGLFKPFIDIILQTYIETLRDNPEEVKESGLDVGSDNSKTAWMNEKVKMNELKYVFRFSD